MNLTPHILEMITQAEQDIHQELQQIPRDDRATRASIGMNRLTVLKNDIVELLTGAQDQSRQKPDVAPPFPADEEGANA